MCTGRRRVAGAERPLVRKARGGPGGGVSDAGSEGVELAQVSHWLLVVRVRRFRRPVVQELARLPKTDQPVPVRQTVRQTVKSPAGPKSRGRRHGRGGWKVGENPPAPCSGPVQPSSRVNRAIPKAGPDEGRSRGEATRTVSRFGVPAPNPHTRSPG